MKEDGKRFEKEMNVGKKRERGRMRRKQEK